MKFYSAFRWISSVLLLQTYCVSWAVKLSPSCSHDVAETNGQTNPKLERNWHEKAKKHWGLFFIRIFLTKENSTVFHKSQFNVVIVQDSFGSLWGTLFPPSCLFIDKFLVLSKKGGVEKGPPPLPCPMALPLNLAESWKIRKSLVTCSLEKQLAARQKLKNPQIVHWWAHSICKAVTQQLTTADTSHHHRVTQTAKKRKKERKGKESQSCSSLSPQGQPIPFVHKQPFFCCPPKPRKSYNLCKHICPIVLQAKGECLRNRACCSWHGWFSLFSFPVTKSSGKAALHLWARTWEWGENVGLRDVWLKGSHKAGDDREGPVQLRPLWPPQPRSPMWWSQKVNLRRDHTFREEKCCHLVPQGKKRFSWWCASFTAT